MELEELQSICNEIVTGLGGAPCALIDLARKGDVSPNDFLDPAQYFREAQIAALMRKFEDFPGDSSRRRERAKEGWFAAERQCYHTNRRFSDYVWGGPLYQDLPPALIEFLNRVKKDVRRILGPVPDTLQGKFGPGATFASRGVFESVIPAKIGTTPTMTTNAEPWLLPFSQTVWAQAKCDPFSRIGCVDLELPRVPGNRWETVPKNYEKDRSIGIEPALNVYYQLGVGSFLKGRLRQVGYLLKPSRDWLDRTSGLDSQTLHRQLAQSGSMTGLLATIDLSSASDTVAYSLVEFLLPHSWFNLLCSLRSKQTCVEGQWCMLEKFSSMGNGFTFELETLLFGSVCRVVAEMKGLSLDRTNHSVYGDDIIVPSSIAHDVTAALRFLGFQLNASKSFVNGPFRESCGGDYFRGVAVRPVFIKNLPKTPTQLIALHNQLKRLEGSCEASNLRRALHAIVEKIPTRFRVYGPAVFGDSVLFNPDEGKWTTKFAPSEDSRGSRGTRIHWIKTVVASPFKLPLERYDDWTAVRSMVYGCSSNGVSPRGLIDGFRCQWVPLR